MPNCVVLEISEKTEGKVLITNLSDKRKENSNLDEGISSVTKDSYSTYVRTNKYVLIMYNRLAHGKTK